MVTSLLSILYPEVGMLDLMIVLLLVFRGLSIWLFQFALPPAVSMPFVLSSCLPALVISYSLYDYMIIVLTDVR